MFKLRNKIRLCLNFLALLSFFTRHDISDVVEYFRLLGNGARKRQCVEFRG